MKRYLDVMTTEYRATIRDMIQHEDTLRDQRLGWLFALNGFLFTGLGIVWQDDGALLLIGVLALVGVLAAIGSAAALMRSRLAIKKLTSLVPEQTAEEEKVLPPVIALRSSTVREAVVAPKWLTATWLLPWEMMPWALALAWLLVPVLRVLEG